MTMSELVKRYETARDRYLMLQARAEGVGAIDYGRVHVIGGTGADLAEIMDDLIEWETEYKEAKKQLAERLRGN